ncbi:MAG: RNA-binding transcriptional accessory protein, partial [Actinomycetia bacterium]|nr:RNA-binding transcriptional accessory protein [Actinomycetes bacterium]
DASSVHPESYPVVERIMSVAGTDVGGLIGNTTVLRGLKPQDFADDSTGLPTVNDILRELEKPGRDPRPEFQTATFAEGVHEVKDLEPGMVLEGVVTNVAAFGAFVDIGVHQDGLVHVSAMSSSFVSDPRDVAKSGDVVRVKVLSVDIARNRISLTMRLDDPADGQPSSRTARAKSPSPASPRDGDGDGAGGGSRGGGRGGDSQGGRDRQGGGGGARGGDNRGNARGGDNRGGARGGNASPPATGAMADALRRAGLLGNSGNAGSSGNSGRSPRRDNRP